MPTTSPFALAAALLAALWLPAAHASKKTVCTITVNSSDEKETFRRFLPRDQYQFVELVEKGRPDWLRSSCEKKVQCDVLVVSGHFNAGETFYSDKIEVNDYLKIDELERASCSESCPGLFSNLKEVYLFGCESLNPDATKYSSSYGESGRDRMRRLFANVPVIYGFYSSAPVGPTAAMLLERYFGSAPPGEIGSGRPSQRMLSVFSRNHITTVSGMRPTDSRYAYRGQVCQFFDERLAVAQKLAFIHQILRRDAAEVRLFFDRIEKAFAAFDDIDRQSPAYTRALAEITADRDARERYLASTRGAQQPAELRARMIELAHKVNWLSDAEQRAEQMRMVGDMLARNSIGFADVELVCSMNSARQLDAELPRLNPALQQAGKASHAAILACLGSRDAHAQVLRTLASPDDKDVQIAQAYLRHRPISDSGELRSVVKGIARMPGSGAQVRAFDALGRLHISDREILDELARSFIIAKSVNVQRAIAEVFIRSDQKAIAKPELVSVLRQHRIRSPDGRQDLIDVLISRLQGTS